MSRGEQYKAFHRKAEQIMIREALARNPTLSRNREEEIRISLSEGRHERMLVEQAMRTKGNE